MDDEDVRVRIRAFLARRVEGRELHDGDNIFELGYVNSLFAMQLARYMESHLGVDLNADDMDIENFATIDGMVRFVVGKTAGSAGTAPVAGS